MNKIKQKGVSIATLTGDNGILTQANNAKGRTEKAEVKEEVELMYTDYVSGKYTGGEENVKKYFQKKASEGEISSIKDNGDGTYIIIKDGYEITIDESGKIEGVKEKEKKTVTEIWYKIDGTTLFLSNSDLGGYSKHDDNRFTPEWAGNDYDISQITKVSFQNELVPTKTNNWFYCFENLTEIENIRYLDTSNVTDMNFMFYRCNKLTEIDVSGFNTSNVTNMHGMFSLCSSLTTLDVSGFDTSNVIRMAQMFQRCENLKNLDLKSFNTSNVTRMEGMFVSCSSLEQLDVSGFDTSKVTECMQMFSGITCQINIGKKWTLTESETSYEGNFKEV